MEKMEIILAETSKLGKAGQRVMLALQPSDVHDPTELPTYLAGYKNYLYRADEASQVILVDHDSDKYRQFNSDDAFRRVDVKGAKDSAVPEVDPASALTTYSVVPRFIGSFIPTATELNAGPNYLPRMVAARKCRNAINLDRELDVWSMLDLTTSWDAAARLALGATDNWNGGTTGDPIKALQTAAEQSAQPITGWWMNPKLAHTFIRHDKVRDHMRQLLGDAASAQIVGQISAGPGMGAIDFQIPGLEPIHVASAKVKNESTAALDWVKGDNIVGLVQPPGVPQDGEEIASSYTWRRRGPSGTGFEVREFRIEQRGELGGTMIVVSMADIGVMISTKAGAIVSGAYV